MFDIGWTELLVIAVVLIVVVGPKDLPPMLRAFGKMMTRFRKVAGEFRAQFDEALKEADLEDVRQTIADAQKLNPINTLREAMTPLRQMGDDIKSDLQRVTTVDRPSETPTVMTSEPPVSLPGAPPVNTPPSAAAAEAPAMAKAVRKPRAKAATKVDEPAIVAPAKVEAPVVASKAKRSPASKPVAAAPVVVVPAKAEAPVVAAKPKRIAAGKPVVATPAVVAETPRATPKRRAPAKKKDDA
jgi:sec-independent protein translocase protein TatB